MLKVCHPPAAPPLLDRSIKTETEDPCQLVRSFMHNSLWADALLVNVHSGIGERAWPCIIAAGSADALVRNVGLLGPEFCEYAVE
jgi:hypothetical protein